MDVIRYILFISVVCCSLKYSAEAWIYLSEPSTSVQYGQQVNLLCTVTQTNRRKPIIFKRNNIEICKRFGSWQFNSVVCKTYTDVQEDYECTCDTIGNYNKVYKINIKSFKINDATKWSCSNIDNNGYESKNSNIVSLYRIEIHTPSTIAEFSKLTVTCSIENARNLKEYVYFYQYSNKHWNYLCYFIQTGLTCQSKHRDQRYDCNCGNGTTSIDSERKTYTFTIENVTLQDAKQWKCGLSTVFSPTVKINVIYGPDRVTITGNQHNFTADGVNSFTLSCQTSTTNGHMSFTWIIGETIITSSVGTVKYNNGKPYEYSHDLKLTPMWYQNGDTVSCSVINTDVPNFRAVTSNITLYLTYAPKVTVYNMSSPQRKTLQLTCEAAGRPASYMFSAFTHSWVGVKIRELPGTYVSPNKYKVTIQPYSYIDSGVYQCSVSNNIIGLNKVMQQTGAVTISIGAQPELVNASRRNVTIVVDIGDELTLQNTIFSRANISAYTWTNPAGHTTQGDMKPTDVTLNIYNTNCTDTGYSISLVIDHIAEEDLGIYSLRVCNAFGCGEFFTHVQSNESSSMKPVTSSPILIPSVSGAAGAVVALLIIVVVICVVRKIRNPTRNKGDGQSEHVDVIQNNTNNQLQNSEMDYNELYFMESTAMARVNPVMEDNELYARGQNKEVNKHRKPTNDDNNKLTEEEIGAMYTVVNKHGKRTTDENSKLTEEEIGAMYTVVNKHGKPTTDDNSKLREEEIGAMYTAVSKGGKLSGDQRDKPVKERPQDEASNEVSEDVSNMYTQVNKNKTKEKNKNELKTEDEDVDDVVEYVNTQDEPASVYQNI